jgi:hypothetical protein
MPHTAYSEGSMIIIIFVIIKYFYKIIIIVVHHCLNNHCEILSYLYPIQRTVQSITGQHPGGISGMQLAMVRTMWE